MIYKARKGQSFYGRPIGILLLDYFAPFIPGDVGNASTFNYPVRYKLVEGLTFDKLLNKDKSVLNKLINAAKELEKEGVIGITADCGFFALFQKEVSKEVKVPVFLSSLLQGQFISSIISKKEKIGVISAVGASLDNDFLESVNLDPEKCIIKGMESKNYFREFCMDETGVLDSDIIESEVVETALELTSQNPDVAAILLECSMLPPYGKAVQEATGLPVFDFITMIDFVQSSLSKKKYI